MIDTTNFDTEKVLRIAKDYAKEHNIQDVVIATTTGKTGVAASEIFSNVNNIVTVTHSTGFSDKGKQELTKENRNKIEKKKVKIFTGPMIFHSWNDYYRKKQGTITTTSIIADTLRLFGQGTKVAVEIVAMAADAGLVSTKPVLSIAGTRDGADTILLMTPANSKRLMEMQILDVIAKPKKW